MPADLDDFAEFYQASYRRMVALVAAMTGDRCQAEDIAQEAYARALTRWPQVARYDLPEAWVRRVAIRLTVDALRRMGRAVRLSARLAAGWNENSRSGTRRCPMLDDELREQLVVWVRPVTALAIPDVRVLRGRARRRRIRRAATAATVTAVVAAVAVSVTVLGR